MSLMIHTLIYSGMNFVGEKAKQKSSEGRRNGIILTLYGVRAFFLRFSPKYIRDEREKVCWRAGGCAFHQGP